MNMDNINYISASTGTDSTFVNRAYCINSKYCHLRFFNRKNPRVINGPCELMEGIKSKWNVNSIW